MSDVTFSGQGAHTADNRMLHIIYGLYAAAFFLTFTAIFGVILAYLQRGNALSDMQRSHIDWQIMTFWWGLLLVAIAFATPFILGWVAAIGLIFLPVIFFIYRISKGWQRLWHEQPIDNPKAFF